MDNPYCDVNSCEVRKNGYIDSGIPVYDCLILVVSDPGQVGGMVHLGTGKNGTTKRLNPHELKKLFDEFSGKLKSSGINGNSESTLISNSFYHLEEKDDLFQEVYGYFGNNVSRLSPRHIGGFRINLDTKTGKINIYYND